MTDMGGNLATACDAFPNSLAGIRLDGATGAITKNAVTGLQQGDKGDGCQEGNAIEVRNRDGTGTPQVSVTGNTVSSYQKTGVLVKGQVSAVVTATPSPATARSTSSSRSARTPSPAMRRTSATTLAAAPSAASEPRSTGEIGRGSGS